MMIEIQDTEKYTFFIKVLNIGARLILNYIAYLCLVFIIAASFFALSLSLLSLIYQFSDHLTIFVENFLKLIKVENFSFSYRGGIHELMRIYFVIALVFNIIIEASRFVLKRYFNIEIAPSLKRQIKVSLIFTHVIYIAALILIFSTKVFTEVGIDWVVALGLFYFINMVALGTYLTVKYFQQMIEKYLLSKIDSLQNINA